MKNNLYTPHLMTVKEIIDETPDIKTFRLNFQSEEIAESFDFKAGQFGLFSLFGEGESTFCIASPPTRKEMIECSVKRVGKVTTALHDMEVGDELGFRGPYGNSFPLDAMKNKNLLFVGGGIGLAPLRSLIWNCIDTRDNFKDISILYGARTVADLVYKPELEDWSQMKGVKTLLTVDPGGEDKDWKGEVGFVPSVLTKLSLDPKSTVVVTCGPPIMIKFVFIELTKLGFQPQDIVTTLENKMKCGLGMCGRCNIGSTYVCKDGPVFTYAQMKDLPDEF